MRSLSPVVLAALCFAAASALVRLAGFDSISDDDHARVAIAQAFAAAPRLDPTGTSWLPVPFWIYGTFLYFFGSGLAVARSLAIFFAGVSGALVAAAGASAGLRSGGVLFAVALALLMPLVPLLGAAPVPELSVAAAIAFALLHLAVMEAPVRRWMLAAGLLFLATLSRYEAWVPALFFAVVAASQARRRPVLLLASLLAVAGPALWVLWNLHAHGHPLAFARRVAAYRAGLGVLSEGLRVYPSALLREAPVALLLGALGLRLRGLRLPLAGAAAQVVALALAELRGGAPTHHPERALLGPVLVLLVASVLVIQQRPRWGQAAWGGVLAVSLWVGWRRWEPTAVELGTPRRAEVALGLALRRHLPPGARVLVVADSYGFFAMKAALARPGSLEVIVPKKVDPRSAIEGDPLEDAAALEALWRAHAGVSWLLLRDEQAPWLGKGEVEITLPGGRLVPGPS